MLGERTGVAQEIETAYGTGKAGDRLLQVGGDVLPTLNSVSTVAEPRTTTINEYCICALTAHVINQRN